MVERLDAVNAERKRRPRKATAPSFRSRSGSASTPATVVVGNMGSDVALRLLGAGRQRQSRVASRGTVEELRLSRP